MTMNDFYNQISAISKLVEQDHLAFIDTVHTFQVNDSAVMYVKTYRQNTDESEFVTSFLQEIDSKEQVKKCERLCLKIIVSHTDTDALDFDILDPFLEYFNREKEYLTSFGVSYFQGKKYAPLTLVAFCCQEDFVEEQI